MDGALVAPEDEVNSTITSLSSALFPSSSSSVSEFIDNRDSFSKHDILAGRKKVFDDAGVQDSLLRYALNAVSARV